MLYKVVPTIESVDEIFKCDHVQTKASEQYFLGVQFIMRYNVVLTFTSGSVSGILKWKLVSSTFLWYCLLCWLCFTRWFYLLSLWMKSYSVTTQKKAIEQYFPFKLVVFFKNISVAFSRSEIWGFWPLSSFFVTWSEGRTSYFYGDVCGLFWSDS